MSYDGYDADKDYDAVWAKKCAVWILGKLNDDKDLLEVGCGVGIATTLFAGERPAMRVTAIDSDPESVKRAWRRMNDVLNRRRNPKDRGNVAIKCEDALAWDPKARFDYVVCGNLIGDLTDDELGVLWRQVRLWLRDDGAAFVTTTNARSLHRLYTGEKIGALSERSERFGVRRVLTSEQLGTMVGQAGLKVAEMDTVGMKPYTNEVMSGLTKDVREALNRMGVPNGLGAMIVAKVTL